MTPSNIACLVLGTFIGVGVVFYQIDTPKAEKCETYKVATQSVVSYALKAPPAPPPDTVIIKEKCPVVLKDEEKINTSDERVEPANTRRHRRHKRRWWK